jgi:hypothetical protein
MKEAREEFFFEKKNQKTFVMMAYALRQRERQREKVFCFFFSKKKSFLLAFGAAPR